MFPWKDTMSQFNAVIAGRGGQGMLLASRVLIDEAALRRAPAWVAATHSLNQPFGAIVTHVQSGPTRSRGIEPGTADLLLALDIDEGLHNLHHLRPTGLLIVDAPRLERVVGLGEAELAQTQAMVLTADATGIAIEEGVGAYAGLVLIGMATAQPTTPLKRWVVRRAIERVSDSSIHRDCVCAFDVGYEVGLGRAPNRCTEHCALEWDVIAS